MDTGKSIAATIRYKHTNEIHIQCKNGVDFHCPLSFALD
jgi:hypothetical protein